MDDNKEIVNNKIDVNIDYEKVNKNALLSLILSIVAVCLLISVGIVVTIDTVVGDFVNTEARELIVDLLKFLFSSSGFVLGILATVRSNKAANAKDRPYKIYKTISKILGIVAIVLGAILLFNSFNRVSSIITGIRII